MRNAYLTVLTKSIVLKWVKLVPKSTVRKLVLSPVSPRALFPHPDNHGDQAIGALGLCDRSIACLMPVEEIGVLVVYWDTVVVTVTRTQHINLHVLKNFSHGGLVALVGERCVVAESIHQFKICFAGDISTHIE